MSDTMTSSLAGGTQGASTGPTASGTTGASGGEGWSEGGARHRLRSQADELMHAAKQRAKDIAEEQKDAAAAQLGCVARGLREAAGSMQGESEFAGRYAGKAAEGLERLSEDLRGADFDQLVERTENYARRNPAVFLGGAVAAGFLLARFIKSSRERTRHRGSVGAYVGRPDASQAEAGVS